MFNFYSRVATALAIASITGCVTLPAPSFVPQPAAPVAASVTRTWDAVLDQLADQGLAVRSIEIDSRFIATETLTLPMFSTDPRRWADCGTFAIFPFAPTFVDFTIFVRGDAASTTLTTNARYRVAKTTGEAPTDCVSTGAFEQSFNAAVKRRAELN